MDWIALTACTLLLGMMVVYAIFNTGVSALTSSTNRMLYDAAFTVSVGNPYEQSGAQPAATEKQGLAPIETRPSAPESGGSGRKSERGAQRQSKRAAS